MKKFFCCFAVLALLLSQALAEDFTAEKRNAFEFTDMYMQRLWEMKYERGGIDATHDLAHYMGYEGLPHWNVFVEENEYYVDVPAGKLVVSVPDFGIVRFESTLISFDHSDEEKEIEMLRAAMAFAALEYNSSDDDLYLALNKIDPTKPANVMVEVADVFFGAVEKTFNDAELMDDFLSESGNKIPFISGNYEYSLQYFNGGSENPEVEFIELIAEWE